MSETLISVFGTLIGTLLGTVLGYFLSIRQSEKNFRRIVLRDIAFEYRRLANQRETGGIHGLIRAGICQCNNDHEYAYVLSLVDDLQPKIETKEYWRPKNGKYAEFFSLLKTQGKDPLNEQEMLELKNIFENL